MQQCPLFTRERIQAFVTELLADPEINIGYLPDALERRIYENVFFLAMKVVEKALRPSPPPPCPSCPSCPQCTDASKSV